MKMQRDLIGGMILGAGTMYLLDPDRGARRRALVRDQAVHTGHRLGGGLSTSARDLRNRSAGTAAQLRSRVRRGDVSDEVLAERVRSAIGRYTSHPGAIAVTAQDGAVTLVGPILAYEAEGVRKRVAKVRGVRSVVDRLEVHSASDDVPGLQGGGQPRGERPELLQTNWAPAIRVITGALGGLLAARGLRTRGLRGAALAVGGTGLLTRAATNLPMRQLTGAGAGRRTIDIRKTINVAAPIERVWDLWSNFENFPRFMSHLREVRKTGDDRSHWAAQGPAGVTVEWDAVTTQWEPQQVIAWKSVEGAAVENAGIVQFRPGPHGTTQIEIRMSYSPPAGALGHVVASFFGVNPKQALDEDMVRLKSLLEEGKTTAHGERVGVDDLQSVPAGAEPPR